MLRVNVPRCFLQQQNSVPRKSAVAPGPAIANTTARVDAVVPSLYVTSNPERVTATPATVVLVRSLMLNWVFMCLINLAPHSFVLSPQALNE